MATDLVNTATAIPASNGIGYGPTPQAYVVYGHTGDPAGGSPSTAVNEYSAMTLPAFMRGVRFLSETLAGLPKQVFRKSGPNVRQRDHGHYLDPVCNDAPNGMVDAFPFWTAIYHAAIVSGNGYALIARDAAGKVSGLYNLPCEPITPFRIDGRQYYQYAIDGSKPELIDAADILHVQGFGSDGMVGYPIVQLMAQSLRIGKAAESYAANYFSNGGHVGGVIQKKDAATPEQKADLRAMVNSRVQGAANSHRWLVLADGWEAEPLTLQNDQAQMLETRQFSVLDIARALSVEPFVLYDYGRATWGNLEQMGTALVRYSLLPWILKTEQQLNRKLFTSDERKIGLYFGVNVDSLTRGDHQQLIDSAGKRLTAGLTTVDEERALADLPPYPGGIGAAPRVAANTVSLATLANPPAAPAPAQPPAPEKLQVAAHAIAIETFSPLVADVSARVGTKAEKATAAARSKFANDPTGWTAWGNVFADQQAAYASAALAPVLATMATLTGRELPEATKIGAAYAGRLRGHYSRIGKGEMSDAPDLAEITNEQIEKVKDAQEN